MDRDFTKWLVRVIVISHFVLSTALFAQDTEKTTKNQPNGINLGRIFKEKGWTIPSTSQNEKISFSELVIDGQTVNNQVFRKRDGKIYTIENYYLRDDRTLAVSEYLAETRSVTAYSLNNNIFAHKVSYVIVNLGGGIKSYAGAVITKIYVDEDGDKIFETRYDETMPDRIPDWAINRKSN